MRKMPILYICIACAVVLLIPIFGAPKQTIAQTPNQVAAQSTAEDTQPEKEPPIRIETPYQPFDQPLVLTEDDIIRIRIALAGVDSDVLDEGGPAINEKRLIRLSGIAYTNSRQWSVWINGARLTPQTTLPQIIDMSVHRAYVDLKWFDRALRKIIKIRLRPNQVYDIATGVLLPG